MNRIHDCYLRPDAICLGFLVLAASLLGAAAASGPIRIARDFPHSFQYQSGERFFPMGDTAYFLIAQPTNVIARFIETRRAHRFNFMRMMPMARGHWAFGGTPRQPDYTVINETAMRKLDWVFDYAATKGMNLELIIFGYEVAQGEGLWANVTNQNFWIDSLVKRYKDRPNLFIWTIANEFERYPDGRYSFSARDVEWVKSVAAQIRRHDATHPIGAHPSVWITQDDPFQHYGTFTQRRPQVVWPLWENSLIDLNITQNNEGVQPRTWGNFTPTQRGLTYYSTNWQGADYPVRWTTHGWDFEAAGMEDCIAEDWAHGKPVLNTEFGYQCEPGGESSYGTVTRQMTTPATVRKKAWKIATAGGYFAAGFRNLAAIYNFTGEEVDHFRPEQLETIYDFFTTKTEYWKMAPHLELVASYNVLLALPGTEYVAYFPRGGTNRIKLEAGDYSVEWLCAESAQYYPMSALAVERGSREFVPPNHPDADWVLHLRRKAPATGASWPKPADFPSNAALPDPLVMLDGRKVTTREMWINERRPELIRLFQHYMYGQLPPKPVTLSAKVERVDPASFGGKATLSEVTLKFDPPAAPPIHLMVIVPNRRTTPAPVVLALNYFGNHTLVPDQNVRLPDNWMPGWGGEGAWSAKVVGNRASDAGRGSWLKFWPIEDLLDRGYALATFYNGDLDPDTPEQRGLQKFFRHHDPADDVGSIGAWAWGLQRAVDYLVTAPGIDPRRIITTGHSRTAKAALVAAAFDDRIALTIPHQAGCGGTAPSRATIALGRSYNTLDKPQTKPPETVFNINDKFPHWFNARFKEFNHQAERLPFDQNCLVALCAPRPVLFTNGRADTWINPAGQFEVLRAAAPVYRLLGAGNFTAEELPPDGQVIGGVLGYYLRPGAHSLLREDWKIFLDFADKHLGRP
ncbi:MAG: hypothetical protein NTW03_02905 [Verrucomicrobia bacterium]|nr:hypothetical protein [Verrucomicrobiota bacterium]